MRCDVQQRRTAPILQGALGCAGTGQHCGIVQNRRKSLCLASRAGKRHERRPSEIAGAFTCGPGGSRGVSEVGICEDECRLRLVGPLIEPQEYGRWSGM